MTAVPARVAIARIIDPTAWTVDRDGFTVEHVHSGEALMKADAILELQDAQSEPCAVPGCDNATDRGICDDCDRWVDGEVARLKLSQTTGMVAVPVDLTFHPAMRQAGWKHVDNRLFHGLETQLQAMWSAMLAAAPTPPAPVGLEVDRVSLALKEHWLANGGAPASEYFDSMARAAVDAVAATLPTPTEDARDRVKVLEDARKSAKALRDAAARSVKSGHRQAHLNLEMMAVALDQIDVALASLNPAGDA